MEGLSDEISLMIALHLPLSDIYHLSLTTHKFGWLMEDQRLFKLLYDRDFRKYASNFPRQPTEKHLHPAWNSDSKLMYKVVEFMRFGIDRSCTLHEVTMEIIFEGFYNNPLEGTYGLPIIGGDGSSPIPRFNDRLMTIKYMNIEYQATKIRRKYEENFDDEPFNHNFNHSVLILKEGLCLWSYNP